MTKLQGASYHTNPFKAETNIHSPETKASEELFSSFGTAIDHRLNGAATLTNALDIRFGFFAFIIVGWYAVGISARNWTLRGSSILTNTPQDLF
jgi:hypothetical protein